MSARAAPRGRPAARRPTVRHARSARVVPSNCSTFAVVRRRFVNRYNAPDNGSWRSACRTSALSPSTPGGDRPAAGTRTLARARRADHDSLRAPRQPGHVGDRQALDADAASGVRRAANHLQRASAGLLVAAGAAGARVVIVRAK
jgi:hypothetical protein